MIQVNIADIGPDGLELSGSENGAFLELNEAGGFPCTMIGDVHYHLHAALAGRDLLATGSASVRIRTQCAMCLKEIEKEIGSDKICIFREKVPNEIIDLSDDIREDILLAVPDRFKCSEKCRGLCPGCGADLNEETCHCRKKKPSGKKINHTWDILDNLDI